MKTTLSYYKPLQKTIQNSLKQQLLSVFWVQIFPQHLNINIELITYFTRILNLRFFFTEFSFFFKGLQKYVFLNNRFYNSLFHLLFTEIFCTKGHINFCTEALLQKFLYPIVQKISVKSRWNKLISHSALRTTNTNPQFLQRIFCLFTFCIFLPGKIF